MTANTLVLIILGLAAITAWSLVIRDAVRADSARGEHTTRGERRP